MWMTLVAILLLGCIAAEEKCYDISHKHCEKNKRFCQYLPFKDFMKRTCLRTCGYCTGGTDIPTLAPGQTNPPYVGKCGQPEIQGTRVVAGKDAVRGSWPWQILLSYQGKPGCGGTLIAPQWVVTAAHCVYGKEKQPFWYTVRVGEYDRQKDEGSEVELTVIKIVRHPDYDQTTVSNDIALLKLIFPVKMNKYVSPACLPENDAPVGSKCYITGWGKTGFLGDMARKLQQGILPVVSNKECAALNQKTLPIKINEGMVCAGSGGSSRLMGCKGDSGGPLVCHIDGRWELHGSVSHGSPLCDSKQTYTVFSRTNYYKEWLTTEMRRN